MKSLFTFCFCSAIAWLPLSVHAGKWSNFSVITSNSDVVVSQRHREQKDGWFVEWQVANKISDWVDPFANSRTYHCTNGTSHKLEKKTLGAYPPGEHRKGGIRDRKICPGSDIKSIEADIELRPVSERIRNMWKKVRVGLGISMMNHQFQE